MHVHCHDRTVLHHSVSLTTSLIERDGLADLAGLLKVGRHFILTKEELEKWPKK